MSGADNPQDNIMRDGGEKVDPSAGRGASPLPPPAIPRGSWRGYEEYIGPHGEMILYQPRIKLPPRIRPVGPPAPAPANGQPGGGAAPAPQDHPHTVSRPPAGEQAAPPPAPAPDSGEAAGEGGGDDVDEEMKRHREWLRHRFDEPPPRRALPPDPDPRLPGTYRRLVDEAADTARRVAALERERYDSLLPDWLWDMLYGDELRILLVHLRSMHRQIDKFLKAYRAGDDPVAALNRYNHEQWLIFLNALVEHIQLIFGALSGIEAIRGFERAMEDALEAANAARQRGAGEWLRTRERARARAEAGGRRGGGDEAPPDGGSAPGKPPGPDGPRLTRRDWRRIRLRKEAGETPIGSREEREAEDRYHEEFPASEAYEAVYGQTVGTVSLSEDGQTVTVTTFQLSPDGTLSAPTVETMPAAAVPEDLGLSPNGSYGFAFTNLGPR